MVRAISISHSRRTGPLHFLSPSGFEFPLPSFRYKPHGKLDLADMVKYPVEDEFRTGRIYDPADFPPYLRFEKTEKVVQDIYYLPHCYNGGKDDRTSYFSLPAFIVSEKFKTLIELIEPHAHQFIPMRLLQKDGSEPWGQYYFFNMRQNLFTLDVEKSPYVSAPLHSSPSEQQKGTRFIEFHVDENEASRRKDKFRVGFVCKADVVGNHHLWRETTLTVDRLNARWKDHFVIPAGEPSAGQFGRKLREGEPARDHIFLSGLSGHYWRFDLFVSDVLWDALKDSGLLGFRLKARGVLDTEDINEDLK